MGAQLPRDSHVSAPPSHRLRIPGHKPQACLQLRVAASPTRVVTPWTPKSLPLPQHRPFGGGRRGARSGLVGAPKGTQGRAPRGEAVQGKEEAAEAQGGGWGRGEQRINTSNG